MPVKWSFSAGISGRHHEVPIKILAHIQPGWHIYSTRMEEGGLRPTRFTFEPDELYELASVTQEKTTAFAFYDSTFMQEVLWLHDSAEFSQTVVPHKPGVVVHGHVDFMACNERMCLPLQRYNFTIDLK